MKGLSPEGAAETADPHTSIEYVPLIVLDLLRAQKSNQFGLEVLARGVLLRSHASITPSGVKEGRRSSLSTGSAAPRRLRSTRGYMPALLRSESVTRGEALAFRPPHPSIMYESMV